jgi:hypothetical protein
MSVVGPLALALVLMFAFICLSPSVVGVCLIEVIPWLVAMVAFSSCVIASGTTKHGAVGLAMTLSLPLSQG